MNPIDAAIDEWERLGNTARYNVDYAEGIAEVWNKPSYGKQCDFDAKYGALEDITRSLTTMAYVFSHPKQTYRVITSKTIPQECLKA